MVETMKQRSNWPVAGTRAERIRLRVWRTTGEFYPPGWPSDGELFELLLENETTQTDSLANRMTLRHHGAGLHVLFMASPFPTVRRAAAKILWKRT